MDKPYLDDIRRAKRECEKSIREAIKKFQDETGLIVTNASPLEIQFGLSNSKPETDGYE